MTKFFLSLIFSMGFFLLVCELAFADPWKDLQSGDQAAQEFLNKVDEKKAGAGPHPFYEGISKEANLNHETLEGTAKGLARKDPAGEMVHESHDARPQIKIDPEHDPLIKRAQEIMENPLQDIGGKGTHATEITQGSKDEILTCEEVGDDYFESCTSNLKVTVKKTKIKKEWQGQIRLIKTWNEGPNYSPAQCTALKAPLLSAARYFYYQPHYIPLAHDITAAYKACAQEGLIRGFVQRCTCGFCRGAHHFSLPLHIKPEKIVNVVISSNLRSSGWFNEYLIDGWSNHSPMTWQNYVFYPTIKITYEEDSHTILPDEWISSCDHIEERADQGLCSYMSKTCTQGKQTRIIDGIPITSDCWQETYTYDCSHPAKDDCGPLRARGCIQINSICKEKIGNVCVVYTQTYQCKGPAHNRHEITGGQTPFCLDGNCRDQSWDNNDEMMSSIAQLSLLKEMQGQMKEGSFFKGEDNQCSKYILHFKDCCGSGKGWSKSIGLGGCKAEEKLLSLKRAKKLCHYVGTYCAKKVLGKCVKKKSSYCCFGNKLLKAFHEQGRPQIAMGWGDAEHPLCRGFSIEEIQRIDFSKLDLSEAFEDLMKNYQPDKLQDIGQKVGDRLEIIKKGIKPNSKQQPQQRGEA